MLTIKENFLETIKQNGNPDRIVNQFEFMSLIVPDPILARTAHKLRAGGQEGFDGWGVTWIWNESQPAAAPYHTPENLVIKDINNWKNELTLPEIDVDTFDWTEVKSRVDKINREESLSSLFLISGVFERLHMLLGFEDALVNMMIEEEATLELCNAIGDHRLKHAQILVEQLKPDMVLSHDDWGTKRSLFMSPEIWRKFIKPQYKKLYDYLNSEGVLIMHHADSFLEPIVEDMVELKIDIWQGVLPENNVDMLLDQLQGRMTLMGGIDASVVDTEHATEEVIRKETRRACESYCQKGHFIPSLTYGEPGVGIFPNVDDIITDEITKYNKEKYNLG